MSPVAAEELLILVEESVSKSDNDPISVLLPDPVEPDPEESEGFQPLLFFN